MANYRTKVISTGYPGSPGYNTYYMLGSSADIADWLDGIEAMYTGLSSLLANGTVNTCDGFVEEFNLSTGQTVAVQQGSGFTQNGSWGTAKAPGGTCLLLQWRTGIYVNGRELRGRSFISGLGDIGDSTGGVGSSNVSDAQTAQVAYGGLAQSAVYSPTNADMASINSYSTWDKFALMRSRRD